MSLGALSDEPLGLIAGNCDVQHVALLFCCGSRSLNAKLSSRTGIQCIQSTSLSRPMWHRFPAFISQLEGLRSISLPVPVSLVHMASGWPDLLNSLPISIEDMSFSGSASAASFTMDLLDSRILSLKSLSLSFQPVPGDPDISCDFLRRGNWAKSFVTKLALDFRFKVPSKQVLALPSTLTDLSWGGEGAGPNMVRAVDMAWFEQGFEGLVRFRLPFAVQIVMDGVKRSFPGSLTCLELPHVLRIEKNRVTRESISVYSTAFSATLPPNLKHLETGNAVDWTQAPCLNSVTSWKCEVDYFRAYEFTCFPTNLQSLVMRWKYSDSLHDNILHVLPPSVTDLQVLQMNLLQSSAQLLPPHLKSLRIAGSASGAFHCTLPISLTSLFINVPIPRLSEATNPDSFYVTDLCSFIPPNLTRLSCPFETHVRLSPNDKVALKWDFPSNWISPLHVVMHDRLDIMYKCFEYGWYQEEHFEGWFLFLVAVTKGSLNFLKWTLSRPYIASYNLYNGRKGDNNGLIIETVLENGRLDVIEMLEAKGLDTSLLPTPYLMVKLLNHPHMLPWLASKVDLGQVVVPNSTLLTEAVRSLNRASAQYLVSIGCLQVDVTTLLLDEAYSGCTDVLDFAHELGLLAPFETPEKVAHFVQNWKPQLLPLTTPNDPRQWARWQKSTNSENPPLRFLIMNFFHYAGNPPRAAIFKWMQKHGYWDLKRTANRTILHFYQEFLDRYPIPGVTKQNLSDWLFGLDPVRTKEANSQRRTRSKNGSSRGTFAAKTTDTTPKAASSFGAASAKGSTSFGPSSTQFGTKKSAASASSSVTTTFGMPD